MRRFSLKSQAGLAVFAAWLTLLGAIAPSPAWADQQHRSYLRIADTGGQSQQIELGLNKSMIVELPRDVREVMVSNPEQVEAVLQTSRRAYLIGRAAGEANIIFVDKEGRQMAILEVSIDRDFTALGEFIGRVIPGAHVKIDALNGYVVLTGTVQNPIDATRAGEIATAFVTQAQGPTITSNSSTTGSSGGNSTSAGTSSISGPTAGGQVINMISVEGREQVLLKVSVVEMERNILKQFGVDLNALINSGSFAFAALSDLPFPINVAGKGLLAPFLKGLRDGTSRAELIVSHTRRGLPNSPTVATPRHRRTMAERRQPRARRAPGA